MSSTKFSDDFKRDAVAQITEGGYPVREVAERLGVSHYSLYSWKKAQRARSCIFGLLPEQMRYGSRV